MFLPFIGLALAATRTGCLLIAKLSETPRLRFPVLASTCLISAVVLSSAGWNTFQRNKIWESDDSLWQTAAQMSPLNGRALTHAAEAEISNSEYMSARESLQKAEPLVAGNASLETDLALAFDLIGDAAGTEKHFQLAIAAGPDYSRAYSALAQWLFRRQRVDEAVVMATKATKIDPTDIAGQHTLMDVYSQQFKWAELKETANRVLAAYPDDQAAQNSLVLAESTLEAVDKIEHSASGQPTAQEYLKLSVFYFQSKRYEDAIAAARSALKINDKMGEAWANISAAQHELGKDDDAIASLREVIRLRPDLTFANRNLDYLLAKKAEAAPK